MGSQVSRGHLVQVIGVPRCGTTMLERMIANGEQCVQCGELADVYRLGMKWPSNLGERRPPEQDVHHQLSRKTISGLVTDSSKERCWVVNSYCRARSKGMNVSNVLVWKTPVELAYSRWKRGEIGKNRSHWKSQWIRVHRFYLNSGIPFGSVRCTDLQNSPATTLERVCDWLGISYFAGKELFWKSGHIQIGGSPTALSTDDKTGILPASELPCNFEPTLKEAIEFESSPEVVAITNSLIERAIPNQGFQTELRWSQLAFIKVLDPIKRFYERRQFNRWQKFGSKTASWD